MKAALNLQQRHFFQMQNISFEVVYLVVLQIYVVKVNKINEQIINGGHAFEGTML